MCVCVFVFGGREGAGGGGGAHAKMFSILFCLVLSKWNAYFFFLLFFFFLRRSFNFRDALMRCNSRVTCVS